MELHDYSGPSVFGYETDAPVRRAAMISAHTSPLATLGGKDAGGMNVYVRELASHLSRRGLPVDIFTRRTDPTTPESVSLCPHVNVVTITAGPAEPLDKHALFPHLPEFASEMALYALRRGVRYDVVHAHYWLSGWIAHLLRRYWATPFVQLFHTTAHMKNAVAARGDREPELRVRTERRLLALADSIIAANPGERADLIWRQGASGAKVCTVPPGVDLERFRRQDRAACRRALGLNDVPVVLFVGRVDPIKGIDTLLDAVVILSSDDAPGRQPCIIFVGGEIDAAGRPVGTLAAVARRAIDLGVGAHVRFVGSQPQDELPTFYGAADVVAVPSRYESFGLVAVEAMASGTPVVASRVGGLAYTVDEEASGLLVPSNNPNELAAALRRVLSDVTFRESLSDGAFRTAQRFAWPAVAAQIAEIYRRLAAGHRGDLCCDDELFA